MPNKLAPGFLDACFAASVFNCARLRRARSQVCNLSSKLENDRLGRACGAGLLVFHTSLLDQRGMCPTLSGIASLHQRLFECVTHRCKSRPCA